MAHVVIDRSAVETGPPRVEPRLAEAPRASLVVIPDSCRLPVLVVDVVQLEQLRVLRHKVHYESGNGLAAVDALHRCDHVRGGDTALVQGQVIRGAVPAGELFRYGRSF